MQDRLLTVGIVGSVVTALCCFTPLLVLLLAGVGLSALLSYLALVLLPALAVFLSITGYAIWRRQYRPNRPSS
jgi:mercuric ion transport protein